VLCISTISYPKKLKVYNSNWELVDTYTFNCTLDIVNFFVINDQGDDKVYLQINETDRHPGSLPYYATVVRQYKINNVGISTFG